MKKSTKVALTLLVPAMTTYGCGSQSKTGQVPTSAAISNSQGSMTIQMKCSCGHSFAVSSDKVGKTAQCPSCNRTLNISAGGTQVNTYHHYRSNSYYGGWFGGFSRHSASSPPTVQATDATGTSHAASRSSSSGFGGIGAHFSGGS